MNIHNFVSDFKNAQNANLEKFSVRKSLFLKNIISLLCVNGYISGFVENKNTIDIYLKYPLIAKLNISLISKSGKRIHMDYKDISKKFYRSDLLIVSTKYGVMTSRESNLLKLGGEVIAKIG